MKKLTALLLSAILLLCAGGCAAAGPAPDAGPSAGPDASTTSGDLPQEPPADVTCAEAVYWHMKIVQVEADSVLVVNTEDGEGPGLSRMTVRDEAIYRVGEQGTLAFDALKPGMRLEVIGGPVAESYPAQFEASAVGILEDGDDLVGLYQQVIRELWEAETGLNRGVKLLGLDFADAGLPAQEREALEYLTGQALGLPYVTGTWHELTDQGYIDHNRQRWEDGVLLSVWTRDAIDGEAFHFGVGKHRADLAAIVDGNCRAEKGEDGVWSYTMGNYIFS